MLKSLGNMIFGSDSEDEGSSSVPGLKRGVPTKISIVYGKSTYELEFSADDFSNEANPAKGLTVLSLKFIVSRILTPKILGSGGVANDGQREAKAGSEGGAKLINPSNFTLIYKGQKLVEDGKYLVDYKVKQGQKIMVLVSNPERVAAAAAAAERMSSPSKHKDKKSKTSKASTAAIPRSFPAPPKPPTASEQIQSVLDQTSAQILPLIDAFTTAPPQEEAERKKEHHRISELLLQKMFMMDGVDVGEAPGVRQERKDAINVLHGYLNRIDEAKAEAEAETETKTETKTEQREVAGEVEVKGEEDPEQAEPAEPANTPANKQ